GVVIGMPRFVFPQIIPEFLVFRQSLVGIFVFGVAILFLQSKVMLYVGYGMRAARPALYIVGFKIMRDFFPVGVGFGEFASYISTTYNSPIYTRYGIQEVSGLNYETHYAYVSDTYWPYIFGQLGVLGTISYLIALYYTFKNVVKKIGNTRGKLTAAIALISYMIFACFAESLLTNSDIIIYALTLSYYLNIDGENI
ncbi:hypothetical protein QCC67_15515, partial [Lactiplantibacillus plantarum]|uniref:hypothetical protein n=4 Tax=Lactiplantibacillus plantarum TaxID=1590 RepID=UPI00244C8F33